MATSPAGPGPAPTYQGSTSTTVQQPIGVPYYIIDPSTGQPAVGPDGKTPLRWGAQIPHQAHFDSNPLTPAEQNRFVTGGGPQMSDQYVLPRYFDGAQWLPAQLPPNEMANLQRQMIAAGILSPKGVAFGVWDSSSMQAFTQVLAYANASGSDYKSALDQWSTANQASSAEQAKNLPVHVTSATDLQNVFRQVGIQTLGIGLDQGQIDQMVKAYQGIETSAGQQANLASVTGQGGTITAPPTAQNYAEQQVRQQNPLQAQEHDVIAPGGPLDAFRSMLKGWA